MHRKFFIFTALLLLICSPALAEPRLWSVHNSYVTVGSTVGSDDYFKTDLSTAKFLNVDLEVVDDNTALLPDININDRESIPKLTISNGNYSYFTGSLVEEVSGGSKTFEIARTDTLVHNEVGYKRTGYNTPGYTATNEEGDWVHFMFNADGGMNEATVTWPAYESNESMSGGSGTVPNFKTTQKQLDDIVPYIEYFGTQAEGYEKGWLAVEGFKWRFVKSSDVTKAVTTDVKITLQVIGSYNHADDCGEDETYYDGTGQQAIVIEAGQLLSGEVKFENSTNDMPFQTVLRYYKGNNKDECYQWRFIPRMYISPNEDRPGIEDTSVLLDTGSMLYAPLKNGKPDYKYTQYAGCNIGLIVYKAFTPEILADVGKAEMKVGEGNYWLKNADDEKIEDVSGAKTYTLFSRSPLLDSYFEFQYYVPGYRKVHFDYLNGAYSTRGVTFMDEGGTLGGQTISCSFPGKGNSWITRSITVPEYQGKDELLASRYIPYAEAISKDNYITEIKFGFVQSPDLDGSKFVTPEHFARMNINLIVWGEEETTSIGWNNSNNEEDYNSHSFKLANSIPIKAAYGYRISVGVDIYPQLAPTWEDYDNWLGEGNSHLDATKCISYIWIFDNLPPVSPMTRLGDDFDNVADNIAGSLSEDVSGILPVEREELGDETGFMLDVIDELEQTESVDVIGRFKQLNVTESGTFAVKVTLPDELYDEIEGAASRDLVVYPITNSEISEPESESESESESASASAARVSGGIKVSRPVRTSASNKSSGKLLASDGKTFNTIDKKEFILTVPLTKAEYEDYTNYGLYLGLKTASDTQAPAVPDIKSPDETPESQDTKPEIESPDNEPEVEDDSQYDYLGQNIDPAVKAAIMKLISTDYEIKTFIEAIKSNDITKYNNNVAVNKRHFAAVSDDLDSSELISVLPAFTFSANEHIIIIMKVSADLANHQELHLYTLKGAEVAGASLKFVRFSSNPDTSEDSGAMFFNSRGTRKITTLTENIVYLAAEFSKGSYAPLVLTGTAKIEEPEKTYSDNILGSSSGGCNSDLFASGALMLLLLMFVKRK